MVEVIDVAAEVHALFRALAAKTIAELNGQELKAGQDQGRIPWHHHDVDEMFFAWQR